MKMKILLISILFFVTTLKSSAQVYWPIWTHHDFDVEDIYGISFGFGSFFNKNCDVNGIKVDIVGLGLFLPMGIGEDPYLKGNDSIALRTIDTVSFLDSNLYYTNGLYLSMTGDKEERINGISIHPIGGLNEISNGVSVFGIMGFNSQTNGVMVTALYSSCGISKGVTISGLYNSSIQMNGLQISFFNRSLKTKGIQIGLWNKNEKRSLPFINWNFKN